MLEKIKKNKLVIVLFIFLAAIFYMYCLNVNLKFLPTGKFLYSVESPNNLYRLNAYIVDGGTLSADAIRVELVYIFEGRTKNIYWRYPMSTVEMEWIDNEFVIINGIKLNARRDIYEYKN